ENGESVRYDRLVIATGARPRTRGIEGTDLPHVFTLHTLQDARRLQAFLRERKPRRALVVGAGYIGLEAADALRRNGLVVTIAEQSEHVLHRDDAELTRAVAERLARFKVALELGQRARDFASYDIVVLAAGIEPNTEVARAAGVALGRTGAIQ